MSSPEERWTDDVNDQAGLWFARKQSGQMTEDDDQAFDNWLNAAPIHREAFLSIEQVWEASNKLRAHPAVIALREAARAAHPSQRKRLPIAMPLRVLAAACVVVAALGAGMVIWSEAHDVQVFQTGVGQTGNVRLLDGSSIALDTDTAIRVRLTGRQRLLYLDRGRAFFRVAHDKSRPFIVQAHGRSVVALGTAFEVSTEDKTFEVVLVEGTVRVHLPGKIKQGGPDQSTTSTVMSAGTRLLESDTHKWTLTRMDDRSDLAWMEGQLRFVHRPLGEVAAEMNRYSRRKIVVADSAVAARPIDGVFYASDLDLLVQALVDGHIASIRSQTADAVILSAP